MSEPAIVEPDALRRAAALAGGINPLVHELGLSRQTFYDWQKAGGAPATAAILIARLTGVSPYEVAKATEWGIIDALRDYFARNP